MISDSRAEQAFEFLRDTVGKIGDAKGSLERTEIMRKRVRKRVFLESSGTVAERDALAECDADAAAADDEYIAALTAYESLRARREIETIALDVWRTESANRRRG
jgi:hypothetical protein